MPSRIAVATGVCVLASMVVSAEAEEEVCLPFGPPDRIVVDTGEYPASVAISDLDADGDADLAVANFDSNDVSIVLNRVAECKRCPEELDHNFVADTEDFFALLGAWGPCP